MKKIILAMALMLATIASILAQQSNEFWDRTTYQPGFMGTACPPRITNNPPLTKVPYIAYKGENMSTMAFSLSAQYTPTEVEMNQVLTLESFVNPFNDKDIYKVEFWYHNTTYTELYRTFLEIWIAGENGGYGYWHKNWYCPIRFLSNDNITITQELIDNNIVSVCSDRIDAENVYIYAFVFETDEDYNEGKAYYCLNGLQLWVNKDNMPNSINEVKPNMDYKIIDNTIYFNETVSNFNLYNLQGALIYKASNVNKVSLPTANKGIYIVRADDNSFKVKL